MTCAKVRFNWRWTNSVFRKTWNACRWHMNLSLKAFFVPLMCSCVQCYNVILFLFFLFWKKICMKSWSLSLDELRDVWFSKLAQDWELGMTLAKHQRLLSLLSCMPWCACWIVTVNSNDVSALCEQRTSKALTKLSVIVFGLQCHHDTAKSVHFHRLDSNLQFAVSPSREVLRRHRAQQSRIPFAWCRPTKR